MQVDKYGVALFSGHARGFYSLPDELLQARAAVERLSEATMVPLPDVDAVRRGFRSELLSAARTGGELPAPTAIAAAEVDLRVAELAQQQAVDALAIAQQELTARSRAADSLITGFLRPAFDAVVDRAAALVARVGDVTSDAAALAAPKAVQTAWTQLAGVAERYDGIRAAAAAVVAGIPSAALNADDGEWSLVDDIEALWRGYRARKFTGDSAPWPTGRGSTRAWLVWVLTRGGRPVLLTPGEREDRATVKYAPVREAMAAGRRQGDHAAGLAPLELVERVTAPRLPAFVRPGAGDEPGAPSGRDRLAERLGAALGGDPAPAA